MDKKHKYLKRFLAFVLSAAMVVTYMPTSLIAYAGEADDGQPAATETVVDQQQPAETQPDVNEQTEKTDETPTETPAAEEAKQPEQTEQPASDNPTEVTNEENSTDTAEEGTTEEQPADVTEAEDKDAEAEKEEGFPEANFSDSASGVSVSVYAPEGALPEGTTMKVKGVGFFEMNKVKSAVKNEMGSATKVVKAVDITFYDKDGKEIQPKKAVSVSFDSSKFETLDKPAVVHIADNGAAEVVDSSVSQAGTATVVTDQFSVYVVVDQGSPEDNARATVNFYSKGKKVASYYVKNADTLEELEKIVPDPGAGTLADNEIFKGWTREENYTGDTEAQNIDDIHKYLEGLNIKEGDTVNIYAMIFKAINITYLDGDDISLGTETKMVPVNDSTGVDYTVSMAYTPKSADENFEGWNVSKGASNISNAQYDGKAATAPYQNDTTMTIKGDVTFSVNSPKGHWLVFDENGKGATYNAPQFVKGDAVTEEPSLTMERKGYNFGGWYTDKDCTAGNEFAFGSKLTDNTTIYAKWTIANSAEYTVLIWQQNVDCDGYDFKESVSLSGTPNATVNSVSKQGTGNNAYARINNKDYQYTGFHLNNFDQGKTIAPEGGTVVNVYYDRNEYTLTFQKYQRYSWTTIKTITAKYQQNISSNFPIVGTDGRTYDQGERWDPQSSTPYSEVLVYIDIMPAADVTFHLDEANRPLKTINYYIETLPGESGVTAPATLYDYENRAVQSSGRNFSLYKQVKARYNGVTKAEDFIELVGFSRLGADSKYSTRSGTDFYIYDDRRDGTINFYYTRDKYPINYMDGVYVDGNDKPLDESNRGQLREVKDVIYGSDLASYNEGGANYYKPTYNNYTFEGWYLDENCTHPYTFNTMPKGGITAYAKWVQNQYRVFLHPNAGTDSTLDWGSEDQAMNFRVSVGGKVSTPTGLRQEYEFVGWYMDEAMTKVFNADAFVLNDTTVTTDYDKTKDFTDPMDKWGNGATTNADVDRSWITKKFDLYGKWRAKLIGADGIGVKYDAGEGTDAPTDNLLYLDEAGAIAQAASTPPEGKQFLHWVLQTWDGNKYVDTDTEVYPGDSFKVLKANAKVEEQEDSTEENPHFTYTVQLRAEYGPAKTPTPTHINWYKNDGTEDLVRKDENLQINEAVTIPSAPSRENYKFIGWAKKADATTPWIAFDNGYKYEGKAVTQVAADELKPYDDMYALWAEEVKVVIKGAEVSKKYNGENQSEIGYTVEYYVGGKKVEKLPEGVTFTPGTAASATGKDVGEYTAKVTGTLTSTSDMYIIPAQGAVTDGTIKLTIIPRTVTLTSADGEKVYDGSALTKNAQTDVTVGGYGFVKGEGATYTITGSQTDVGESPNAFTYELNDGTKASNYTITKTEGTLKVTPVTDKVTVTITENNGEAKYDGTEKTVTGYSVKIDNELYTESDFTFSGKDTVKGTDAGSYPMELKPTDFTNNSKNFSNVEFKIVDGTLEISKRTVTLTSATDAKTYDGTALTNKNVTVGGDGFVEGEGATYDVTGTQTEAGSSKNTFTYTLNDGTKADNYTISKTEGTLTVTADEKEVVVVITENSGSEKYDGTEKTVKGYEVTSISSSLYKKTDFTFNGNDTVKGTDAGSYPMELKPADFTNNNKNFTNVKFQIVDGTLEISKRAVTLTSADDKKVYDGTALTNDKVTVGGDGFANDEGAAYDVTGSQTDAGESANSFSYTLNEGTKAANYNITTTVGTLTVTPVTDKVTVTITGHKDEVDYNGSEQKVEGYDVSIDNKLYTKADFSYDGDATAKATDVKRDGKEVGTYPMGLKEADFKNISKNFTNVEFKVTDGSLKIIPLYVTITSGSDKKTYDGKPLTKHSVEVEGFVEGEGLDSVKVTGSQTYVGTSKNTFEYKLYGENLFRRILKAISIPDTDAYDRASARVTKKTKADNYNITKVEGDLEVTDKGVNIDDVTKKTHENKEYKLGETVVFTIEVTNIYAEDKDITVEEQKGVKITSESKFEGVKPGAKVKVTAEYVVTEDDILAGTFKNTAKVTFSGIDDPYEPEDVVDIEDPKPHMTITKDTTSKPQNGEAYAVGETITYNITATNDGNLTIKDVEVKDDLTGDVWTASSLAPGESKTFTAEYKVTEKDAENGSVTNNATATGKTDDPNHPTPTVVPGSKTVPVETVPAADDEETTKGVKTGDDNNLAGWLVMLLLAGAGIGGVGYGRRRKED